MRPRRGLAIVLLGVAVGFPGMAYCEDPNKTDETALLKAEIALLRSQVKAQAAEIENLKAQVSQSRVPKGTTQSSVRPTASQPQYTYRGRQVTKEEFGQLYRELGSKMLYVDGKLLDTGEALAWDKYEATTNKGRNVPDVDSQIPLVGSVRSADGEVTAVKPDAIIVHKRGMSSDLRAGQIGWNPVDYRIRGLDVKKYADGSVVSLPKVTFVGTCTVGGRTLQDYVLSAPAPTETQFAEALAKGLELNRWTVRPAQIERGETIRGPKAISVPVK